MSSPLASPESFSPLRVDEFTEIGSGFKLKLVLSDSLEPARVIGVELAHAHDDGTGCGSFVAFDGYEAPPTWTVLEASPLTLSPSIRMGEHFHGHIVGGKWQ